MKDVIRLLILSTEKQNSQLIWPIRLQCANTFRQSSENTHFIYIFCAISWIGALCSIFNCTVSSGKCNTPYSTEYYSTAEFVVFYLFRQSRRLPLAPIDSTCTFIVGSLGLKFSFCFSCSAPIFGQCYHSKHMISNFSFSFILCTLHILYVRQFSDPSHCNCMCSKVDENRANHNIIFSISFNLFTNSLECMSLLERETHVVHSLIFTFSAHANTLIFSFSLEIIDTSFQSWNDFERNRDANLC